MATETAIFDAIKVHIKTTLGAVPISWPNMPFTPPATGIYYRVSETPVSENYTGLSETSEFVGLVQIDIMSEQGKGVTVPRNLAGDLASAFRRMRLSASGAAIAITNVTVGPTLQDDPRMLTPVTVRYRVFA